MNPEDIVWEGRTFRRYPDHPERSRRVYFMSTNASREYLHRAVYAKAHGPIPQGWHVHHKDHDPLNNHPSNLEALSPAAHGELHGRELPDIEKTCHGCGVIFQGRRQWAKWCTPACKERFRRAHGLAKPRPPKGPFLEQRQCEECSVEYTAKRPWARYCTAACKRAHGRSVAA